MLTILTPLTLLEVTVQVAPVVKLWIFFYTLCCSFVFVCFFLELRITRQKQRSLQQIDAWHLGKSFNSLERFTPLIALKTSPFCFLMLQQNVIFLKEFWLVQHTPNLSRSPAATAVNAEVRLRQQLVCLSIAAWLSPPLCGHWDLGQEYLICQWLLDASQFQKW